MKYMLLIYIDEQALSETEREQCYKESTQLTHELNAEWALSGGLRRCIRRRRRPAFGCATANGS